jgi:hypothetical protein
LPILISTHSNMNGCSVVVLFAGLTMLLCGLREMDRREKVEEARRETERILAAQEAEVAARKVIHRADGWPYMRHASAAGICKDVKVVRYHPIPDRPPSQWVRGHCCSTRIPPLPGGRSAGVMNCCHVASAWC